MSDKPVEFPISARKRVEQRQEAMADLLARAEETAERSRLDLEAEPSQLKYMLWLIAVAGRDNLAASAMAHAEIAQLALSLYEED